MLVAKAALPVVVENEWSQADLVNPARKISFYLGAVLVFLRFSMLHQYASWILHHQLYMLYLFAPPALLGVMLTGGFRRTWQFPLGKWWTAYGVWMVITVPFSTWRGGAASEVLTYLRTDFTILFIIAGLTLTWDECLVLLKMGAAGAALNLLFGRIFAHESAGERMDLSLGMVANSNDFAAHLIITMSFLFFVVLCRKNSSFLRIAALGGIGLSIIYIFRTASRGGLIALVAMTVLYLAYSSMAQRMVMIIGAPVLMMIVLALVPGEAMQRITSFSRDSENSVVEANMSQSSRRYLLRKSIEYTFTHPLFGLGPGQFATYEGTHNIVMGTHGSWHQTHNTFTQVSSELGLPGFVIFTGGTFMILGAFRKIHGRARHRPECQDIAAAGFAMMLGFFGFVVAITFLSFGYFFYFPAMGGLAVALARAADAELKSRPPTLQPYVLAPSAAR
jgi:O-antigen ligase